MDKDKNNIIKEIREELGKYLNNGEINSFCEVLADRDPSWLKLYTNDSVSKERINVPKGTDKRAQIDSLITFATERLPENKMTELLLNLEQLMYYLGEMEISADMSQEVLSRTNRKEEYDTYRAEAYLRSARLKCSQGYREESKSYARKAHKIYIKNDDPAGLAKYQNLLGTISGEKGDLKKAASHFEKGPTLLESSAELKDLYLETGRVGEAELYERYLTGYERRAMCTV